MNVGIIGMGKMGQIRKSAIEKCGHIVDAVYDVEPKNTAGLSCALSDHEEMFSNPNLDAIFVCTPNYLNKELVIKALESNKHAFCEKPPALTAQEVEEIIDVEKTSGKVLMYGFNHRHHESIMTLKRLIESGEYGNILWMRGRYGKSSSEEFFDGWRAKRELSGGGILIDQGIHMLDLFLYLVNDFHDVRAFVSNQYWKTAGVEDNVFAILKNNDTGVTASLHSTMTQWRHLFSFEIFLEKGYFTINGLKTSSGTYGPEVLTVVKNRTEAPMATWSDEESISYDANNSWDSEVQHFFDCIENQKAVEIGNTTDALKLMRIIDRIYAEGK